MTDGSAGSNGLSGIVLLGGGSRRMGRDKARLLVGRTTLVQRTVNALAAVVEEIVLVRAPAMPRVEVEAPVPVIEVTDRVEDAGPLAGLIAGLEATRQATALVTGVDQPFLQPELLRLVAQRGAAERQHGIQWVVPVAGDRIQPLCSAVTSEALEPIRAHFEAGERSLVALERLVPTLRIAEQEWRAVDPEGLSFLDVDTPEEYEAALLRYERLGRLRGTAG